MASDEHDGGQQRLPRRDLADDPHEAGDQEEARDVEAENAGSASRRAEVGTSTCRTRPNWSRVTNGSSAARRWRISDGRGHRGSRAAMHDREVEREIAGLRARPAPSPRRSASCPSRAATASARSSRKTTMIDARGCRRPARSPRGAAGSSILHSVSADHRPRKCAQRVTAAAIAHGAVATAATCATKPASVMSCLCRASSFSRNFTMSAPVRKAGFSACFSM